MLPIKLDVGCWVLSDHMTQTATATNSWEIGICCLSEDANCYSKKKKNDVLKLYSMSKYNILAMILTFHGFFNIFHNI